MTEDFKNFDEAVNEAEAEEGPVFTKFQFQGETFEVDLNVHAGKILRWMEEGGSTESVPGLLKIFLGEEDYNRLLDTDATWPKMEQLLLWLVSKLGSTKN